MGGSRRIPAVSSRHDSLDRVNNRLVTGAAAVIATDFVADLLARGRAIARQQFRGGQQHSGRAKAALQRVSLYECFLQIADLAIGRQSFDADDVPAVGLDRKRQASAHDDAVEHDVAGAAHAVFAADMRAGETKFSAQQIDQVQPGWDARRDGLAVEPKGNFGPGFFVRHCRSNCARGRFRFRNQHAAAHVAYRVGEFAEKSAILFDDDD